MDTPDRRKPPTTSQGRIAPQDARGSLCSVAIWLASPHEAGGVSLGASRIVTSIPWFYRARATLRP